MRPLTDQDPRELGGYRLLARLGQGGMGRVYLAEDRRGALAALKVVHPERAHDPEFRRRFAREVRLAARVHGPGVASVTGADPDAETPWLAAEFVSGPTLSEAIARHGELPAEACRALAEQLAEALTAVHATGLVHRDLKPSNVILGADGARLIDFGIALATDESAITRTGQTPGTAGYIAPEVLLGGAAGPAADVFALGALLAFAAQGRHPYGSGPEAVLMARPLAADPDLSGITDVKLAALLRRALAREPAHRPSLAEFAGLADLGTAGGGSWIPPSLLDDIGRRTHEVTTRTRPRRATAPEPHPPTAMDGPAPGTRRAPDGPGTSPAPPGPQRRHFTRRGVLGLGAATAAAGAAAWLINENTALGPAPKILWRHAMKGPAFDPLVTRDTVYAISEEDGLVALDIRTGAQRWHRSLNGSLAGPVLGNGMLYHSGGNRLTALDSRSGATRWSVPLPGEQGHAMIPGPDLLYMPDEPVRALDATDGSARWSYAHDPSHPGIVQGLLWRNALFVYSLSYVDRVDATTGKRVWRAEVEAAQDLAISDGTLYVSHFGGVSLLNPVDGTVRKTLTRDKFPVFDIAVAGRALCIDDMADDRVHGLDALTGEERWSADLGKHTFLSELDGGALAVTSDTMVCAVDAGTGVVRWRLHDTGTTSTPVIANGVVYVGTERRGLLALSAATSA
ncbi:serine/threonine-protein kinase [Streptomyces sp. TLI_105]|uniref:serine/threonine-protein kinase n=1 Tax=Streptomyces sp. TLI_105 TaxID=1881019 RepID=UPI00089D4176|nr:serine/threonine-protein kinase [Streptomyces sp. TLI_105]SEE57622.1 Serine/threonine protein kinase [Streptomyces sp. TLI_105]